ncbi:hypothetical protein C2S53_002638 [Perilla frutescens var. hirtella]|uniref:Uncharacterized protein n=1 Tax=Perilla frutescens var. hirtella TaxID=608512 RepID=A0AAD4IPC8_PERFH|nr:hypothetical protein C2S53_002638 [Perilla frutescens var. hirtella]
MNANFECFSNILDAIQLQLISITEDDSILGDPPPGSGFGSEVKGIDKDDVVLVAEDSSDEILGIQDKKTLEPKENVKHGEKEFKKASNKYRENQMMKKESLLRHRPSKMARQPQNFSLPKTLILILNPLHLFPSKFLNVLPQILHSLSKPIKTSSQNPKFSGQNTSHHLDFRSFAGQNKGKTGGIIDSDTNILCEAKRNAHRRSKKMVESLFYRLKNSHKNYLDNFLEEKLQMIYLGYDRMVRFMEKDYPNLKHLLTPFSQILFLPRVGSIQIYIYHQLQTLIHSEMASSTAQIHTLGIVSPFIAIKSSRNHPNKTVFFDTKLNNGSIPFRLKLNSKQVQRTRRSERLAEKSPRLMREIRNENPIFSKKDLFTNDSQEMKLNFKESLDGLDEISGVTYVSPNINLEENSVNKVEYQANSTEKQDITSSVELMPTISGAKQRLNESQGVNLMNDSKGNRVHKNSTMKAIKSSEDVKGGSYIMELAENDKLFTNFMNYKYREFDAYSKLPLNDPQPAVNNITAASNFPAHRTSLKFDHNYSKVLNELTHGKQEKISKTQFKELLLDILLGMVAGLKQDPVVILQIDGDDPQKFVNSFSLELGVPPTADPWALSNISKPALKLFKDPLHEQNAFDRSGIRRLLSNKFELKKTLDFALERVLDDRDEKISKEYMSVVLDNLAVSVGLPPFGAVDKMDSIIAEALKMF